MSHIEAEKMWHKNGVVHSTWMHEKVGIWNKCSIIKLRFQIKRMQSTTSTYTFLLQHLYGFKIIEISFLMFKKKCYWLVKVFKHFLRGF